MIDIAVVTYNQEKYISQAIESILNQECDFKYRIIIGEDCSTDNTYEICKDYANRYPDKIALLRNNTNLGLVKNYHNVFNHCKSKYIAILEGDDYWIDHHKLQQQYEILESNDSIGLVHTGSYSLYENGEMKKNHLSVPRNMLQGNIYESLLIKKNTISPMTVLFRKVLMDKYVDFDFFIREELKTIDYAMWLAISKHSEVAYIEKETAIYRFLNKSVSRPDGLRSAEEFYNTSLKVKKQYYQLYPVSGFSEKEILSNSYFKLAQNALTYHNRVKAKMYSNNLIAKGFYQRFMKATINYSFFVPFWRVYIQILPWGSRAKQVIYKIKGSN